MMYKAFIDLVNVLRIFDGSGKCSTNLLQFNSMFYKFVCSSDKGPTHLLQSSKWSYTYLIVLVNVLKFFFRFVKVLQIFCSSGKGPKNCFWFWLMCNKSLEVLVNVLQIFVSSGKCPKNTLLFR